MSYRNITGWGLRGLTPGPAVCTSTSGRDPLAGGHRLLAVSPTRSSWRVVPRHEQHHGFFLSRHAGRCGPRGLDRMRSVGGGLALRAQRPRGREAISPQTQSTRQAVLCLDLPSSAGLCSAFSWEVRRLRRRGIRKTWNPAGVPTARNSFRFFTFSRCNVPS